MAKVKKPADWRNRIVGYGMEDADQLLANPANWRIHPKYQQDALKGVLNEIGWVQNILVNKTTGHVVDGHLRAALAITAGAQVPVTYVELTEDEERLILATLDPIAAMAARDDAQLADLLASVSAEDAGLAELLKELAAEMEPEPEDNKYSRKIEAPTYEPSGTKPKIADLYDDTRTRELCAEIDAADFLAEDERAFLKIAAQRHTVLNFAKIADYYAHSAEDAQALMENNALVIIDMNRAIELGLVRMTEKISALVRDEYGD